MVIVLKLFLSQVFGKSKTTDVGVVVLGSENSKYTIDENVSYNNITVVRDLQPPSWGMVEDVTGGHERSTTCGGDILEAIIVAMSLLRDKG